MLQNFRFARYRLTYTVQEPLTMPSYKGNIFRGQIRIHPPTRGVYRAGRAVRKTLSIP